MELGKWHRSKSRKDTNYSPFGSYLMNKKWTLEEEFTNHMMRFIQVTQSPSYFIADWSTSMSRLVPRNCWRQLSYAIKNQLVASKAPY